jgi:hypothetical protein
MQLITSAIPDEPQTVKYQLTQEDGEFAEMLTMIKDPSSHEKTSVRSNLSRASIPIKNFEKALSNSGSPLSKKQKSLMKTTLQPID